MSSETLMLMIGALCLILAGLGGGIETKWVKFPIIKTGGRFFIGTLGGIFILVGLCMFVANSPDIPTTEQEQQQVKE